MGTIYPLNFQKAGISNLRVSGGSKYTPAGCVAKVHERPNCSGRAFILSLAIAVYFIFQRQIPGTAFAAFFFFENFLNIATYMTDARRQELPLVTVGDADYVEHDWAFRFGKLGVLDHDTSIAAVVRVLGWLGMTGVVVWLW